MNFEMPIWHFKRVQSVTLNRRRKLFPDNRFRWQAPFKVTICDLEPCTIAFRLDPSMAKEHASLIPAERIEQAIIFLRGEKVMLDSDLAALYGVTTKQLNQAVKR